jgi:uncharacterized iron-regulated membrane protein
MKKASFLSLHRWVALTFAPLILLQAVTGMVLLFREPLARLIDPISMTTEAHRPPARIGEIAAAAESAAHRRIDRLFLPRTEGSAALARMESENVPYIVTIDPASGRVLSHGSIWRYPTEAALDLHYQLLRPPLGAFVVVATGTALTLIAMSGALFWWPGRGRIVQALKVRKGLKGMMRLRAWHRSVGAVALVLIGFSALTGLVIAVTILPPLSAPLPGERPPLSIETANFAVEAARREFPGAEVSDVRFRADGSFQVNLAAPERNAHAVHRVALDTTGRTVTQALPASENAEPWVVFLPLHSGTFLGPLGQLVLALEAAVLVFLGISGPLSWWRKSRKKTRG